MTWTDFHRPPDPVRRRLRVFAGDPLAGWGRERTLTLEIPYEKLERGPEGKRISVVDFDGASSVRRYYEAVDLDSRAIVLQDGLEPSEGNPLFHQQMVYAVAMKLLEAFDGALGRTLLFRDGRKLRLVPHSFQGANAFYDAPLLAILFGYFRAHEERPGRNLPGQHVFTCLSHDIIAHEMTHAVLDRIKSYFIEDTGPDSRAFHEGFADLVAIFHQFSFSPFLRDTIEKQRGGLSAHGPLVDLAEQFGQATGKSRALRSALDRVDPRAYQRMNDPYRRGSLLVAAVFEAFYATYQRRARDLVRIATAGSGVLPEGDLHPDLVGRLTEEASMVASATLRTAVRALDYTPAVDVTFTDYLRAMVTADYRAQPDDPWGLRASLIESFRRRGIYEEGMSSLGEESLRWPRVEREIRLPRAIVGDELVSAAERARDPSLRAQRRRLEDEGSLCSASYLELLERHQPNIDPAARERLSAWAGDNRAELFLHPTAEIRVAAYHYAARVSSVGAPKTDVVLELVQTGDDRERYQGLPPRGATTVIAGADGRVKYVLAKPIPSAEPSATLPEPMRAEVKRRDERLRAAADKLFGDNAFAAWEPDEGRARAALLRSLRGARLTC